MLSSRLLLPAPSGELHITLKRGEPYTSWNIGQCAKETGWKYKTCREFIASAYPGYAHRRTRGASDEGGQGEEEGEGEGEEGLRQTSATNTTDNKDIQIGAMTYIFTRDSTRDDEDEFAYNAAWTRRYGEEQALQQTKAILLEECERIYKETTQRNQNAHSSSSSQH